MKRSPADRSATFDAVLEPFDPSTHPRRLNLGCGFDHREGYLNVDFQDFHHPDLVADVRDLSMLPDAYYEEIIAQDVLEHLYRQDVAVALSEWARLLAVGGTLVLRVPDIIGVARLLSAHRTLEMQQTLVQNLFGTQAYTGDYHHVGFTEITLRTALADAGFVVRSLVHHDEWLFDAIGERVTGNRKPDLDNLGFMQLCIHTGSEAAEAAPVATAIGRSNNVTAMTKRVRTVAARVVRGIERRFRSKE